MMNRVFLSLGSNLGERQTNLSEAICMLRDHEDIDAVESSPIYQTAPVGYLDQADFLNIVIELKTTLTAEALLEFTQSIERHLGRKRTIKNGPRIIDLDILLFNEEKIKLQHLEIPHPRMHERAFVLIPFADLDKNIKWPHADETIASLITKLKQEDIEGVKRWDRLPHCGTIADK